MRYEVQWWYEAAKTWMKYNMCFTQYGARRVCCKKLMNVDSHHKYESKWRVIDRQTNIVLYVFMRKS